MRKCAAWQVVAFPCITGYWLIILQIIHVINVLFVWWKYCFPRIICSTVWSISSQQSILVTQVASQH